MSLLTYVWFIGYSLVAVEGEFGAGSVNQNAPYLSDNAYFGEVFSLATEGWFIAN